MNYIELINKFWTINLEATFSHAEVHLYFKLLEINNRLGWKNEFKCPNTRLEGETGMRTKTLINARQRLIDFGLITYKKGSTRKAGVYCFSSLQPTKESNKETNKESNKGSNVGSNKEVIRGTLNKLNKTKQEERGEEISPTLSPEGQEAVLSNTPIKLKEAFSKAATDTIWLESVCMRFHLRPKENDKDNTEPAKRYLSEFYRILSSEGVEQKSISDLKSHFARWLNKQNLNNNGNG